MKKEMYFDDFYKSFQENFNGQYKNNFSINGLKALFDYFLEYEESTGEDIMFDVIAICCDYSEYKNLEELQNDYNLESIEELKDNTQVIMIDDDSFIIQVY